MGKDTPFWQSTLDFCFHPRSPLVRINYAEMCILMISDLQRAHLNHCIPSLADLLLSFLLPALQLLFSYQVSNGIWPSGSDCRINTVGMFMPQSPKKFQVDFIITMRERKTNPNFSFLLPPLLPFTGHPESVFQITSFFLLFLIDR